MLFMTILSCLAHKTSLTGVIDNVGLKNCVIELNTGDFIVIKSSLCKSYREGDEIVFYGRKNER